jgi:Helix-hairpin-helix motif
MKFLAYLGLSLVSASLIGLNSCANSPDTSSAPSPAASAETTTSPTASQHNMSGMSGKKININDALLSELDKLEAKLGVPALSNKIQGSRPYGKPEELVSKKVIDQAQFDQIKDMVTIEKVELTGEAKDVDYMTKLGLMKGHLIVAKELLDLKKVEQAEPHIGHPVEEIYADVEEQLNERKIPEFKTSLNSLLDMVKAGGKDTAKMTTDFNASVKSVDGAIAALPVAQRTSSKFVLQVINGLLDTANSEYGAAIADGKISQAVEYQDSRGFVVYANELYKTIEPQLRKDSPAAAAMIGKSILDLAKAWPAAIPPAVPVKTPAEVTKLVKEIEAEAQKAAKPAA